MVIPIGTFGDTTDIGRNAASQTAGGLAGRLLRVTNLSASGPGSLAAAIEANGPRFIVFDVGGVIDLDGLSVVVRSSGLTIAGQTAPDPGITLIRGGLAVETHDVVIEHIAVRPGDGRSRHFEGDWAPDALGARRSGVGDPVYNVVFDHCSATWAIDENLSVSGPADNDSSNEVTSHDVILRHCLIAEGLSHSTHPKGEHSKGTLLHDGVRNVTITGCVYASNRERNPRLKGGTTSVIFANVMYNWESACVGVGSKGNRKTLAGAESVVAGNFAIAGPDTRRRFLVHGLDPGGRVFLRDNLALDAAGSAIPMADQLVTRLEAVPAWTSAPPASDAIANLESALRSAGSRPARRDPIDARIIQSIIRGDGRIIDSQEQVGGYPVRPETRRVLDIPQDAAARRELLERLSRELETDPTLDLTPLWTRLHLRAKP